VQGAVQAAEHPPTLKYAMLCFLPVVPDVVAQTASSSLISDSAFRRPGSKSVTKSVAQVGADIDGPPLLVLPSKGSRLSPEPGTPSKRLLRTVANAETTAAGKGLARATTNLGPEQVQQTLGRTTTNLDVDFMRQTLGRTTTGTSPDFLRQTLGRTNTNMGPDFLRQTLGRTNTNMGSGFFGRTLGRATTGMGSMAFGATMGRTGLADFGMTQPVVPPLLIDPLVTAMMQKASSDVPLSQPRSTSPAFAVRPCRFGQLPCCFAVSWQSLLAGLGCAVLRCAALCCAVLCCVMLKRTKVHYDGCLKL